MARETKALRLIRKRIKSITDDFEISKTGSNHIRVVFTGKTKKATVFFPSTPSESRSMANAWAEMMRDIKDLDIDRKDLK